MADNVRNYPDVDFVDTNTSAIVGAMIQGYEHFTGRTLYPADPARLFILWIADIIVQERANINFSAKMNLPRFAEGKYLDSLAELFNDAYRLPPAPAKTTLRFTISAPMASAIIIPKGTRATVDGEIVFATTAEVAIRAGKLWGDAPAECTATGTTGNGFLPGQINQLVDLFPYFENVQNTTESEGGANEETDAAFYERMRESMETYSTAGAMGAYEYYAKTASALIVDAKATSPSPGCVNVRVLLQGGELPGEEMLQKVYATLSPDDVRAFTDFVTVEAPDTVPYEIDFTYYMLERGASGAEEIEQAVARAVEEYKLWQSESMGRDINPSRLEFLLMKTGIKRAEIRNPTFERVAENAVAVVGETDNIISGGFEDG